MSLEKSSDDLDQQFETNIDEITKSFHSLLMRRTTHPEIQQFFDWFSKWSNGTIKGSRNPGYPRWLARLTELSESLENPALHGDPLARAARMISHLINDISYRGTEEDDVQRSLNILQLLKKISV